MGIGFFSFMKLEASSIHSSIHSYVKLTCNKFTSVQSQNFFPKRRLLVVRRNLNTVLITIYFWQISAFFLHLPLYLLKKVH